jgi:molybdopterin converting factor small subunit
VGALAGLVPGGGRRLTVEVAEPASVAAVLDEVAGLLPALERRMRDEQGVLRRHVDVHVDGADVRMGAGLQTGLGQGAEVLVLPSVAGG